MTMGPLHVHATSSRPPAAFDILLLPEMAFTGYEFKDRAEIEPYAEMVACDGRECDAVGSTVDWARRTGMTIMRWPKAFCVQSIVVYRTT